jgi:hypothetical protein
MNLFWREIILTAQLGSHTTPMETRASARSPTSRIRGFQVPFSSRCVCLSVSRMCLTEVAPQVNTCNEETKNLAWLREKVAKLSRGMMRGTSRKKQASHVCTTQDCVPSQLMARITCRLFTKAERDAKHVLHGHHVTELFLEDSDEKKGVSSCKILPGMLPKHL